MQKTEGRIVYSPRVFVSKNEDDLAFDYVNYENVDCWGFEIDTALLKKDEFSGSTNHFYTEQKIEPAKLKLHGSY